MKKVLGIIGSPRKLGNSELAIKEISRNIKEPHELKLVRLNSLRIELCRACYSCIMNNYCPQKDDFKLIMDALCESDAVIIAAPCYILGPNASIKLFVDRLLQVYSYLDKLFGKPAVAITVAGLEGGEGYAPVALSIMAKILGLNLKECATFFARLPGEILLDEKNLRKLAHLGEVLFDEQYKPKIKSYLCPICFSDTFQFLSENEIKCMVCRHKGTISQKDGRIILEIKPGQDVFFMSYEAAMKHKEWLKQLKEDFFKKKELLKETVKKYSDYGMWLTSKG